MIGLRERYGLSKLRTDFADPNTGLRYAALDERQDRRRLGLHDRQPARRRPLHAARRSRRASSTSSTSRRSISRKALAAHGPRLAATLNAVSALLTTPVMRELNAKADATSAAGDDRRRVPARQRLEIAVRVGCLRRHERTIRVAVCDDARAVKFFLRTVLEEEGDMQVVSTTSTGQEALERAGRRAGRHPAARPAAARRARARRPRARDPRALAGDGDPADVQPAAGAAREGGRAAGAPTAGRPRRTSPSSCASPCATARRRAGVAPPPPAAPPHRAPPTAMPRTGSPAARGRRLRARPGSRSIAALDARDERVGVAGPGDGALQARRRSARRSPGASVAPSV